MKIDPVGRKKLQEHLMQLNPPPLPKPDKLGQDILESTQNSSVHLQNSLAMTGLLLAAVQQQTEILVQIASQLPTEAQLEKIISLMEKPETTGI